jgi:predicted secreted protein
LNSYKIKLSVGEKISINVPCNPTTGYDWVIDSVKGDSIEISTSYQPSDQSIGAGGIRNFTIKGLKSGIVVVNLTHKRAWEVETLECRTYKIDVT